MNLLTDPILTLSSGDKVSLPSLFAAMSRGQANGFPALRPHQRPAWHMFLVQLAALSLRKAGRDDVPEDAADWAKHLRGLTGDHADDVPWRLVVEDPGKPAFLQPPDPGGLEWSTAATPDALDLLITSRNHDLKQAVAKAAKAEDWVFALISLQTSEGYGGRGHYGIARMNGGSSSRPMLGLAPSRNGDMSIDPSAWWARDVRRLIATERDDGIGAVGGPALLWCLDWPEGLQLDLCALDPWFIEVCRRVRLTDKGGVLSASRATSKASRTNAKVFNGNIGDPWAPVHRTEGKSFTLNGGDFGYAKLCELLFSGDWARPFLAQLGNDETSDMLLVAEALARGNSKTEGFKSRVVLVPESVAPFFSSETAADLSNHSKAQMDEIKGFDKALRDALALMAAGGNRDKVGKKHYAYTASARSRFDHAADQLFFPSLWRRVAVASQSDDAVYESKHAFLTQLMKAAQAELNVALPAIPCTAIHRPRAEARARRAFRNRVWKDHPELFGKEDANVAA